MTAVPPPLNGLMTAPSLKAKLVQECVGGSKPTIAVNNAAELMPEDGPSNSRFVPPTKVIARGAKSVKRER